MAGFYPDVPAPRMAYDRDGTVGIRITGGSSVTQLSAASLLAGNDENTGSYLISQSGAFFGTSDEDVGLIFPEPRDIIGFYHNQTSAAGDIETSINSTTGLDGTWISRSATSAMNFTNTVPAMRQNIATVSWLGVRAIRINYRRATDTFFRSLHLYGSISSGSGADRVRLWHPTLDEPLDDPNAADGAYLDWGDVTRGTNADRTFRVKNNSSTLTANSIEISTDVPTNTSPSVASQMTFSDGGAFATLINIGALAPGAISSVITMRRTIPSNAVLSLWTGRVTINPGTWT